MMSQSAASIETNKCLAHKLPAGGWRLDWGFLVEGLQMDLDAVPKDVWREVCFLLSWRDIWRLRRACSTLWRALDDDIVWRCVGRKMGYAFRRPIEDFRKGGQRRTWGDMVRLSLITESFLRKRCGPEACRKLLQADRVMQVTRFVEWSGSRPFFVHSLSEDGAYSCQEMQLVQETVLETGLEVARKASTALRK